MQIFQNLLAWKKSYSFSLSIYKETSKFPKQELFGLTSQLRRASVSISANIAEGCGKNSQADLCKYLDTSMGSANECLNYILLAKDLGYVDQNAFNELEDKIIEIRKVVSSLIQTIRKD